VHVLALIALLLLSLFGYSLGVVVRAGKSPVRKASVFDLLAVAVLWAAAIFARGRIGLGPWLMVLAGIAAGFVLGFAVSLAAGASGAVSMSVVEPHLDAPKVAGRRFRAWRRFSYKVGTFQSQVFLGLIFTVLFAPVGLGVRLFSDPLAIKAKAGGTYWSARKPSPGGIEESKRQF